MPNSNSEMNSPEYTAQMRDKVVRRMLNTPPKPLPKPQEGRRPGRPIAS